jgi:hypothetical protein
LPGIYTVTPIPDPDASAAPSPTGSATAGASPRTSASPAGGAVPSASGVPPLDDPLAPVRFAVDLFDVDESTIAPGSPATIEALGRPGGATPAPDGDAVERPTARDELWVPVVLAVLGFLCLEWAMYHRDALVRLRRGMAARLGRGAGAA